MSSTVQSIFRQHFTDYASTRSLPGHQYKAANAIIACRTAQLGGHIQTCENGHVEWADSGCVKYGVAEQCGRTDPSAFPCGLWVADGFSKKWYRYYENTCTFVKTG